MGFDRKSRTLTDFVEFEEHMGNGRQVSHKTVAKSLADGVVPGPNVVELAILVVYMRRINYDSATVNISVFIKQRNISF